MSDPTSRDTASLPRTTAPDRPDIFISYSRTDQEFVESRLHAALMARDKECWVDLEDIRPAADWLEAIHAGIDEGLCFAVVIGQPWLDSDVCRQEYDRALASGKRLIGILRHDVDLATLPDALRRGNWIMMREGDDFDAQFERLIEAMETDLAWIERHARLTVRTHEWDRGGRDRGALLRGRDLADAEEWFAAQGQHGETPTAAQGEFIVASRRARGRASRIRLVAVTAALVVSAGLGVLALLQRNQAQENERTAVSRQFAALSQAAGVRRDLDSAGLLGVEALQAKATDEARTATLQSLLPRDRARGALGSREATAAIAFSPDGRRLAVGQANGNITLWDVRGRRRIATLGTAARVDAVDASLGAGMSISAVQFSPDGQLLATAGLAASGAGSLRVWDVRRGMLLQRRSFSGYVYGLLFNAPRRLLWAAGPNLRLWDLKTDRTLRRWSVSGRDPLGEPRQLGSIALSADGHTLAGADAMSSAGDTAGRVHLWDLRTAGGERLLRGSRGPGSVAFAGGDLLTIGEDGTVRRWDPGARREIGEPTRVRGLAGATAVSRDGAHLAGVRSDGVRIVRVRLASGAGEGAPLRASEDVGYLAFDPAGTTLASSGVDGVRLWDTSAGGGISTTLVAATPVDAMMIDTATPTSLVYASPRRVLVGGDDGTILAYDALKPGAAPRRIARFSQGVEDVARYRGGVVVAGRLGSLSYVPLRSPAEVRTLLKAPHGADETPDVSLAVQPNGRTVAIASSDAGVQTLDGSADRPKPVGQGRPAVGIGAMAFSADGKLLVKLSGTGPISAEFWDMRRRRSLGRVKERDIEAVAVSPDGKLVATGLGDGTLRLIDAATRKRVGSPLRGHRANATVTSVAFSPDGRTLASGSQDRTIRLWDVATRRHLVTSPGHASYLVRVAFSPDGKQLASIDDAGQLQTWSDALWTTSPGRLRKVVCRSIGNNSLGRAEWRNLVGERPYHRTCG